MPAWRIRKKRKSNLLLELEVSWVWSKYTLWKRCAWFGLCRDSGIKSFPSLPSWSLKCIFLSICLRSQPFVQVNSKVVDLISGIWCCAHHSKSHHRPNNSISFGRQPDRRLWANDIFLSRWIYLVYWIRLGWPPELAVIFWGGCEFSW